MRLIKDISVPKATVKSRYAFSGEKNGALTKMKNISDRSYPSIVPRGKRAILGEYGRIVAFLPDEIPARIENGRVFIGDTQVSEEYIPENFGHTLLRLGEFILLSPYGMFFHASNFALNGTVRKSFSMGTSGIDVATVDKNMNAITEYTPMRTPIPAAEENELWAKPRDDGGYEMMRYDGHEWRSYESYVRLKSESLGRAFKVGDVLACEGAENVLPRYIRVTHSDSEGICFAGATPHVEKIFSFSVKRPFPFLQQTAVCGGRAVGVYCGYGENGEFISKAYASAINDPLCWSEYGGALSVDIGGSEPFNAIAVIGDEFYAFRENSVVRLRLNADKISFSVTECEGVGSGAIKSVSVIGDKIYYKSPSSVCVFDGNGVKRIPAPYGKPICDSGNGTPAASYGGKYYVLLKNAAGQRDIYVYNPDGKIWCVENDIGVSSFMSAGGMLLAVCDTENGSQLAIWDYASADNGIISRFAKEGYPIPESTVSWTLESEPLPFDIKNGMHPARVFLRGTLNDGASISAGLIYGGRSIPDSMVSVNDIKSGYFEIPMRTVKGGMPRIAIYGRGDAELTGYEIEYVSDKA